MRSRIDCHFLHQENTMGHLPSMAQHLKLAHNQPAPAKYPSSLNQFMSHLGIENTTSAEWVRKLPFAGNDVTAGSETELQTAVIGARADVDLAQAIEHSNYYKNMAKRAATGESPVRRINQLLAYLETPDQVWENSWIRFPRALLNAYATTVFDEDMRADKSKRNSPHRCDAMRFMYVEKGEHWIRIPASYLLKIALAHAIGDPKIPAEIKTTGREMMDHFLNDNTSPETHSFHPTRRSGDKGVGTAIAVETLTRYLLTQLLIQYANQRFRLEQHGQKAIVYFAPHPPIRQKALNELISDAFYRELFMSPCLSGWDCGEKKHRYMALCHEVLSRSQLNTLSKLKEAGIIANNLVVMPNTSNISLANNGTHISFGSQTLTHLLSDPKSGFGDMDEKYYGDLVLKISEHFLPLFVGTYSAAPYRLSFWDFHSERALGFLPHQLDYTHLRMIWRRWKGKADIKFLGRPITPFGPEWLDRTISRILRLKGDYVLDYRLLDYLVALLSTDESPALDGRLGNDQRLRADLQDMGIFHRQMPFYMLCRLRQYRTIGFSGIEARHFSLFENFVDDMGSAADLQNLITLLAYKYIFQKMATHQSIPDSPTVESERRQFFFGAAIGLPTFYVHKRSPNHFLSRIIKAARRTRSSRRYNNYIRIPSIEYRKALVRIICEDAKDLIEMLQLENMVTNLKQRIHHPETHAVSHRLTQQILQQQPNKNPLKMKSCEFNREAEAYYRDDLKKKHINEAFGCFKKAVKHLDSWKAWRSGDYNNAMLTILKGKNAGSYLASVERPLAEETLSETECKRLIHLVLLLFHQSKTEMNHTQATG